MTQKYTSYSFIEKSKIVHGDLYGYSEFEYVDSKTIGKIICKIHGSFDQTPRNHLRGNGCQICANNKRGKSLTKENFGNPKKYPPCYWNGKLKKFASELYQNTLKSDQLIKDSGYNLVSLWERDLKSSNLKFLLT